MKPEPPRVLRPKLPVAAADEGPAADWLREHAWKLIPSAPVDTEPTASASPRQVTRIFRVEASAAQVGVARIPVGLAKRREGFARRLRVVPGGRQSETPSRRSKARRGMVGPTGEARTPQNEHGRPGFVFDSTSFASQMVVNRFRYSPQ